jgi:hypothetical protein
MTGGPLRRGRTDDTGAASLEYTGMIAVVVMLVGSIVLSATPIGSAIKSKICQAVGASCGNYAAQERFDALTKCVVRRDDRSLGFGGNVRFFNLDRKDGDRVVVNSDGSASVTLSQSTAGGVGITGKTIKKGGEDTPFSVDAKIQVAGDLAYVYNVPSEWGGEDTAQRILDDKAGTLDRYGNLILGPWATSAVEGLGRAADGVGNAVRWGLDKLGIDEESDEERAARERVESLSQADAIQVSLGLQGAAGVSGDAGLVKGSASGTASAKGTVQVSLNGSGEDRATSSFTGTVDLKGTLEGVIGIPGDGRPGQAPSADIPPFLSGALVGGALWSYKVEYDSDGNPSKLTLITETAGQLQGGIKPPRLGLPGGSGTSVSGKANGSVGSAEVEEIVLDLTDPENAAAFNDLFLTYGVGVADHRAQVSQMKLYEWSELMDRADALSDRIMADALVVRYNYDLYGTNVGAGGQQRQSGVDFVVGGVNWEDSSLTRELTGATAYDMSQGGLEFQIVDCGS